ncbi:hypothetical protein FXN80_10885 [Dickeya fangzhongdai]|uniref:hypothetical protein n=1 Tax=Dickeya fangzhongdai TaxID=1778540 RepID=UPI001370EC25|nr:hypothetical protein [Dickeya fangzhongdai]UMB78866.1 hypothetical protein FXN80_10885 [Dickeya fangzhongdai]
MPSEKKQKWILTHDSHALKKGDTYEGTELPLWLAGKTVLVGDAEFEVATPGQLAKLQADLDAANAQVVTLTESTASVQAALDEEKSRVSELTASKTQLQADLDAANKQLTELQKKAK